MRKKTYPLLVLSWIGFLPTRAQTPEIPANNPGLVPLLSKVEAYEGKFTLPAKIVTAAKTADAQNVANFLKNLTSPTLTRQVSLQEVEFWKLAGEERNWFVSNNPAEINSCNRLNCFRGNANFI